MNISIHSRIETLLWKYQMDFFIQNDK